MTEREIAEKSETEFRRRLDKAFSEIESDCSSAIDNVFKALVLAATTFESANEITGEPRMIIQAQAKAAMHHLEELAKFVLICCVVTEEQQEAR